MKFILGKKIGMSQMFDKDGNLVPVSLISAGPCYLLQQKNKEKDGYDALQIGFEKIEKKSKIKKTMKGKEYRYIREIRNPKSEIRVGLLNCGAKRNILRSLLARGVTVYDLPWNFDPFVSDGWQSWKGSRQRGPRTFTNSDQNHKYQTNLKVRGSTDGKETTDRTRPEFPKLDGLVISNGPGDPKMAKETINIIKKALKKKIPTFGICLGNQLLALATGGDTYKLKFGHRAQNQPTIQAGTKRCYITTQNHGFAVDEKKMPKGFKRWFHNANDNTNEGIIHENLSFFSVQFHPEASPGPTDTEWLFDYFLEKFK